MEIMVYVAELLITICVIAVSKGAHKRLGVYLGEPDKDQKYPYVVTFIRDHQRACSGTLIAPNWVLTAGQCTFYEDEHKVQYGNLSVTPSEAKQVSKVMKAVKHPSLRSGDVNPSFTHSNLQLVLVDTIPLKRYGNVSAVDYKAITGTAVEFASLEVTYRDFEPDPAKLETDNVLRPLMLGQGIVTMCDSEGQIGSQNSPLMCVAPTCENRFQTAWAGDSGGPLFYGGKIIGVLQGAGNLPVIRYTAISPFVDWIYLVITQNSVDDVL